MWPCGWTKNTSFLYVLFTLTTLTSPFYVTLMNASAGTEPFHRSGFIWIWYGHFDVRAATKCCVCLMFVRQQSVTYVWCSCGNRVWRMFDVRAATECDVCLMFVRQQSVTYVWCSCGNKLLLNFADFVRQQSFALVHFSCGQ